MIQYLLSSAGMVQPTRIVVSWAVALAGVSALTQTARTIDKTLYIETFPFFVAPPCSAAGSEPPLFFALRRWLPSAHRFFALPPLFYSLPLFGSLPLWFALCPGLAFTPWRWAACWLWPRPASGREDPSVLLGR